MSMSLSKTKNRFGALVGIATFVFAATFLLLGSQGVWAASSTTSVGLQVTGSTTPPPPPPPVLPSAPTLTAEIFNDYQVRAFGNAEYPGTVYVTISGTLSDGTPMTPVTYTVPVNSSGTWMYETGVLDAGSYTVSAYVQTLAGDSPTTTSPSQAIDVIDPSGVSAQLSGTDEIKVMGNSFPGGETKIKIVDSNGDVVDTITVSNNNDGSFSYTTNLNLAPDTYKIYTAAVDGNGEVSGWAGPETVNVPDASIPAAPTVNVAVVNDYSVQVSGTAEYPGVVYVTMTGTYADGSGVTSTTFTVPVNPDGTYTLTTDALPAGNYSFSAVVENTSGKTSFTGGPGNINLQISLADNVSVTTNANGDIVVSGESFPGGSTKIQIVQNGTVIDVITVDNAGSGNFSSILDQLPPGEYQIFVAVVDSRGESSAWGGPYTATAGQAPFTPVVNPTLSTPTNVVVDVVSDGTIVVTGSATPGTQVKIQITDTKGNVIDVITVTVGQDGTFEGTLDGLKGGDYKVYVASVDGASGRQSGWAGPYSANIKSDTKKEDRIEADSFLGWVGSVAASGVDQAVDAIGMLTGAASDLAEEYPGATATSVVVAASIPFLSAFFNLGSISAFLNFLKDIMARASGALAGIFAKTRRKKEWGMVYDDATGEPIAFVVVSLYGENGRFVESKITDAQGSFYFLVPAGKYILKAEKDGYVMRCEIPSNKDVKISYADEYTLSGVTMQEEGVIHSDIALVHKEAALVGKAAGSQTRLAAVFGFIGSAVFWSGFAFNVATTVRDPRPLGIFFILLYIAAWMVERAYAGRVVYGVAKGPDGKKLPFVWINVYNKDTRVREARTITDEHGRYFLVLNAGRYIVEATSVNGNLRLIQEVSFSKRKALNNDLSLANKAA